MAHLKNIFLLLDVLCHHYNLKSSWLDYRQFLTFALKIKSFGSGFLTVAKLV